MATDPWIEPLAVYKGFIKTEMAKSEEIVTEEVRAEGRKFIAHRRKNGDEQLLETHLQNVGGLASDFASKINIPDAGRLIGLLHDFGKYSQEFQNYINSATDHIDQDDEAWVDVKLARGKIDHSTAGAQYIWHKLQGIEAGKGTGELVGQILALCVASHHSGLIDCLKVDGKNNFCSRMDKPDKDTHLKEAIENVDEHFRSCIDDLLTKSLVKQVIDEARKTICQLDQQSRKVVEPFALGMLTRFLFSCLIDADRLDSAEFEIPDRQKERLARADYYKWQTALARFNEKIANFAADKQPIDKVRCTISDSCAQRAKDPQGVYTLSVPTGGGKTLTSLRYALQHAQHHQLDRIIYVIPYTSIIEQNARVARDFLEREGDRFPWVLEHHSNLDPEKEHWRTKLLSENWDVPVVFTTMVQFLETLFSGGTRSVRRLHQLANAVIIFDEIQTLPIKCVHLFCNALNYLTQNAKTTAVLCTATQPLLHQLPKPEYGQLKLADNHELIDNKTQLFTDLSRVAIHNRYNKRGGWQCSEIVDLIWERFQQHGSCLTVVNTKRWASTLYESLANSDIDREVLFHLSTNQCAAHREARFKDIKSRLAEGLPVLCISTQLIEAGVDVDFASVVRFLAGLDSINQAAGRCNRNGLLKDGDGTLIKGRVDVINPADEPLNRLTDIYEGARSSERIFRQFAQAAELLSPKAMDAYYQDFFFKRSNDRKNEMIYPIDGPKNLLSLLGGNCTNPGAELNKKRKRQRKLPLLQQSFMEAGRLFEVIDAPTRGVIVPYGDGKALIKQLCAVNTDFDMGEMFGLLKKVQRYSVNVFSNEWDKLKEVGAVSEIQEGLGVYYLDDQYYSEAFGVSSEKVSEQEFLYCG